jgi:thiol-disulfide isomerase/thioredoxin
MRQLTQQCMTLNRRSLGRHPMRIALVTLALACILSPARAQTADPKPTDVKPTDARALKTYETAVQLLRERMEAAALGEFKKADKQDGGHCYACQKQMLRLGIEFDDWKSAELAAQEMVADAKGDRATAIAHYEYGVILVREATQKHKEEFYTRAHDEFTKAVAVYPGFPDALFQDGKTLAQLHQDEAAKARFEDFAKMEKPDDPNHQRALRYISNPELARARMAPAFTVTTLDGQHISMDDLQGKVVLLDFWATWCGPCREALPHLRNIAKKFDGQPLVVLSVSLDANEEQWKKFIAENGMTWAQYRDGGFTSPISKLFGVEAIPHTFTIDAEGVLQDEHIGDASIEGKLKKLLAQARELQPQSQPQAPETAAAK